MNGVLDPNQTKWPYPNKPVPDRSQLGTCFFWLAIILIWKICRQTYIHMHAPAIALEILFRTILYIMMMFLTQQQSKSANVIVVQPLSSIDISNIYTSV